MSTISVELPKTPAETIQKFHSDELMGEALFRGLFEMEPDPTARLKLAHLAQIEIENAIRLREALVTMGVAVERCDEAVEAGRAMARSGRRGAWGDYVRGLRDRLVDTYIPQYRSYLEQAERRGDPREVAACRLMLSHEQAFHEFAQRDLAGEALDHVLEPLISHLRSLSDKMAGRDPEAAILETLHAASPRRDQA